MAAVMAATPLSFQPWGKANLMRHIVLLLALILTSAPAMAAKRIALSFDDVPRGAGAFLTPDQRTQRILRALKDTRAPQAVFFVVPGQIGHDDGVGGEARIAAYVRANNVIANHSWSHRGLSQMGALAYLDDIDKADAWLRYRPGFRPWFRFPFLDEGGPDKVKRDAVRGGLRHRRLTNGYVTAESSDWYLDGLASEARKAGKPMDMQALGRLYVTWHVEAANFSDALLRKATGRQAAHVLLLHETDLAAFYLADLIRALRADGWTLITADQAYADPLGREIPDTPSANGTLSEALAWQRGLPAPRWYTYNNTRLAKQRFDAEVLGEQPSQ
jgi:peptidoglycan-N-acetylglucosamine deacetylase